MYVYIHIYVCIFFMYNLAIRVLKNLSKPNTFKSIIVLDLKLLINIFNGHIFIILLELNKKVKTIIIHLFYYC